MFKQRIASLDYSRRGSWLNYTNASFPHLNCIILCFCNLSSDPARKSEMRNKSVLIYFKYQVSIKLVFKYGPCCAWMYHNDILVGPLPSPGFPSCSSLFIDTVTCPSMCFHGICIHHLAHSLPLTLALYLFSSRDHRFPQAVVVITTKKYPKKAWVTCTEMLARYFKKIIFWDNLKITGWFRS